MRSPQEQHFDFWGLWVFCNDGGRWGAMLTHENRYNQWLMARAIYQVKSHAYYFWDNFCMCHVKQWRQQKCPSSCPCFPTLPPCKKGWIRRRWLSKNKFLPRQEKPFAEYLQQILERVRRVPVTSYFHGLSWFNKCTPWSRHKENTAILRVQKGHNLSWSPVLVTFLTEIPDLNNE